MSYRNIILEREEGVATLTLNRPDALNALDWQTGEELLAALEECAVDAAVRVVVLAGAGRAFCAGGDLRGMARSPDVDASGYLRRLTLSLHPAVSTMIRMSKPIIARVQGAASGAGMSLVLAADLAVAAQSTRFNMAYLRVALSPDLASTYFLPRFVGLKKALDLFFTGDAIDSAEALRLGLVNQVVPDADLEAATLELARRLARGPALAPATAKELAYRGLAESLESQMEHERQGIVRCAASEDFREGAQAFFEKREPRYR